jgi:AraC-like DNA-binding protein
MQNSLYCTMAVYFRYNNLSVTGVCNSFSSVLEVDVNSSGTIVFPQWLSEGYMQHVQLPSGFEILFSEYNYNEDIVFIHEPEQAENFVLWIDCAEGPAQEYDIEGVVVRETNVKQHHAYLMSSLYSISHLRRKGNKGKSILIFIPDNLFSVFFNKDEIKEKMKWLYNLPGRGLNFSVVTPIEMKKIDGVFYQWEKYRNTLGMAKYVNQLLEWFFLQLFQTVEDDMKKNRITDVQVKELEKLRSVLEESVTEERIQTDKISHLFQTPFTVLEQIFAQFYSKTIFDYFKTKKMEYAFNQLINTEKSVGDIAFEIGYANPSNFSAAFRKKYNINPQDMREKNRLH